MISKAPLGTRYFIILFSSLYSSMVERNTVNILINVRFILKAFIIYRKHLMTIIFKFKRISKAFWFNNIISDAGGGSRVMAYTHFLCASIDRFRDFYEFYEYIYPFGGGYLFLFGKYFFCLLLPIYLFNFF